MKRKLAINVRIMPLMLITGIVGILIVSLLDFVYSLIGIIILVILLIVSFSIERFRKHGIRLALMLGVFILFTLVGGEVISKAREYQPPIENVVVSGRINSDSAEEGEITEDGKRKKYKIIMTEGEYYIDKETKELDGKIQVNVEIPIGTKIEVGDIILVSADIYPKVVKLTESVNVYNYIEGVRYTLDNANYMSVVESRASLREQIKIRCRRAMTEYVPAGGIMYSMVFGGKVVMSGEFVTASRITGIAHLFAVSGLHLGMVAGIVGWITKRLRLNRIIDYIVVLLISGLYAMLVGYGASVMRALLMLVIYKTGKIMGLRYCGVSSLSLSGIIILIINPLMLYSMSFQLSVMAITGILFFVRGKRFKKKSRREGFKKLIRMNISVNIALLPVMLHYFGKVSLIFLIANLLIVPIITIIFPIVFIVVLMTAIYGPIGYVLVPMGYVFSFIEMFITSIAGIKFLEIGLKLSVFVVIGYVGIMTIISSYSMINKKVKRMMRIAFGVVLVVVTLLTSFGRIDGSARLESVYATGETEVMMLDVKDEHYLIVNGILSEKITYTVQTYMSEKGIWRVDGLVKTEFSGEEIEYVGDFAREIKITRLITSKSEHILEDVFEEIHFAEVIGEYIIEPISSKEILITNDKVRVTILDNRGGEIKEMKVKTDILYCIGENEFVWDLNPKYYVNNTAVKNYIPQSCNSYFTFILKNDNIMVV